MTPRTRADREMLHDRRSYGTVPARHRAGSVGQRRAGAAAGRQASAHRHGLRAEPAASRVDRRAPSAPDRRGDERVDPGAVLEDRQQVIGAVEAGGLGRLRAQVGDLHDPARAAARRRADLGDARAPAGGSCRASPGPARSDRPGAIAATRLGLRRGVGGHQRDPPDRPAAFITATWPSTTATVAGTASPRRRP